MEQGSGEQVEKPHREWRILMKAKLNKNFQLKDILSRKSFLKIFLCVCDAISLFFSLEVLG